MILSLIITLSSCGKTQITKTKLVPVYYKELVPVPEELTKQVWVPELPQRVTFPFVKNELIPTLFSQLSQCNKQLEGIENLRVDEDD